MQIYGSCQLLLEDRQEAGTKKSSDFYFGMKGVLVRSWLAGWQYDIRGCVALFCSPTSVNNSLGGQPASTDNSHNSRPEQFGPIASERLSEHPRYSVGACACPTYCCTACARVIVLSLQVCNGLRWAVQWCSAHYIYTWTWTVHLAVSASGGGGGGWNEDVTLVLCHYLHNAQPYGCVVLWWVPIQKPWVCRQSSQSIEIQSGFFNNCWHKLRSLALYLGRH